MSCTNYWGVFNPKPLLLKAQRFHSGAFHNVGHALKCVFHHINTISAKKKKREFPTFWGEGTVTFRPAVWGGVRVTLCILWITGFHPTQVYNNIMCSISSSLRKSTRTEQLPQKTSILTKKMQYIQAPTACLSVVFRVPLSLSAVCMLTVCVSVSASAFSADTKK